MPFLFRQLLLAAALFTGAAANPGNAAGIAPTHEQGRAIYNYRCYFCHGYSGDSRTLASTYLTPPPRNFTDTAPRDLPRELMLEVVADGKPGTAMHGFSRLLDAQEIAAVVDFVRFEFIDNRLANTRYHTIENGWPNHDRYREAFPFATGELTLDKPWEQLTAEQTRGKQLYLTSCITCHDRAIVENEGVTWSKQSISYPRNNYSHTEIDALSSASIYAQHDSPPRIGTLSAEAAEGRELWQQNCAFCHAADGTGENWIGSFLEPKPRNLADPAFMGAMTRGLIRQRIRDGIPNTSMPAWRDVLDDTQIERIISYIDLAFHPVK